jgi:hypothetical protein
MAAIVAAQQPAQTGGNSPEQPQQVDVDQMNVLIPGLIERVEV